MKTKMTNTRIGAIVAELRKFKNYTQEHLAELADVNVRTVQRLEAKGVYSQETLAAVASAFDVDCQFIIALANLPVGEQAAELEKKYHRVRLTEVTNGKGMTDRFISVHMMQPDYPPDLDETQSVVVGELLDFLQDYLDIQSDLCPSDVIAQQKYFAEYIEKLRACGLRIFAGRLKRNFVFGGDAEKPTEMDTLVLLILREADEKIVLAGPTFAVDALLERNVACRF